jgi:hypothetical protein
MKLACIFLKLINDFHSAFLAKFVRLTPIQLKMNPFGNLGTSYSALMSLSATSSASSSESD